MLFGFRRTEMMRQKITFSYPYKTNNKYQMFIVSYRTSLQLRKRRVVSMTEHDNSQRGKHILQYKIRLCNMSDFFLFEVEYCDINRENISGWRKDLRDILWEIKKLQDDPDVDMLFVPYEDIRDLIGKVLVNLSFASDMLRGEHSMKYRPKKFYQVFLDCSKLLSHTTEIFKIIPDQERPYENIEGDFDEGDEQIL